MRFFGTELCDDIGTLGGNNSFGNGINASGQITGSADKARGVTTGVVTDAFLYTPAKGAVPSSMIDLGDLGGGGSEGLGINNSGQVTGDAYTIPGPQNLSIRHAFLWDGTMHDLGALGGSGNSFGRGINNRGQVTGYSDATGHAFLYTPDTGMVDLNTLLPSGSGWILLYGNSINDAGQITGQGINPSGAHHAFVLTPPLTPLPGGATVSGSAVGKPASGTADAVFTATVNNITNVPLTVNCNTADGTAVAGIDYAATAGTLTFLPGSNSQNDPDANYRRPAKFIQFVLLRATQERRQRQSPRKWRRRHPHHGASTTDCLHSLGLPTIAGNDCIFKQVIRHHAAF